LSWNALSTVSKLTLAAAVVSASLLPIRCRAAHESDSTDLSTVVRGSRDVCSAIARLHQNGRDAEIAAHSMPPKPESTVADPRGLMTPSAWAEAAAGAYGISNYLENGFNVARIKLAKSPPAAWVFSTTVGSLNNPLLWIFSSTQDGRKAAHLLAQLGEEGSGPFDTYFVRFKEQPYAVTRAVGEKGTYLTVYRLGPATPVCSFPPR
jgi:hypothetical protein